MATKKNPTADLEALMGLKEEDPSEEIADKVLALLEKECEDPIVALRALGIATLSVVDSLETEDEEDGT